MNELERFQLADSGDEGYMRVVAGPRTRASPPSSPAPACRWATTTCACSRPPNFLGAVRDGEQRGPGLEEMVAAGARARRDRTLGRSGAWELARDREPAR